MLLMGWVKLFREVDSFVKIYFFSSGDPDALRSGEPAT
jgi:hypothetical protein